MNDREITKIVEDVVNNIKSKPEMTLKLAKKLAEKVEAEAAKIGDVFITLTGDKHVIDLPHLLQTKAPSFISKR